MPLGSSPRMRGSRCGGGRHPGDDGIIPAHAGLTHALLQFNAVIGGSSPRMRGSLTSRMSFGDVMGIIPAHAGLTLLSASLAALKRDHPRACGAHYFGYISFSPYRGSSPRMRGSRTCGKGILRDAGIIPAHAGLTLGTLNHGANAGDHPRACGAHAASGALSKINGGSSPRMRGSHHQWYPLAAVEGIIPAHAGLTYQTRRSQKRSRDHPRACGAHCFAISCLTR